MSKPQAARTTSAAKSISPTSVKLDAAPSVKSQFEQSRASTPSQTQSGSAMVKQDAPKPAPRPSPSMAAGPDAAAFNARWKAERAQAEKAQRRAKFIAEHKAQCQGRSVNRSRSD